MYAARDDNTHGAHGGEKELNPLDEIVRTFNERWFQDWSATAGGDFDYTSVM